MSSDRKLRARRALPLVALALVAFACGKKGDPAPPPRTIPQPVRDLTVGQRGLEVVLEFGYPKTTMAGLALPALAEVTIYEAVQPAPGGAAPPPLDERALAASARPRLVLQGAELAGAVSGDRMVVRFRLEPDAFEPPAARTYAVRTLARGGEASPWSNPVVLVPKLPPAPPVELRVTARKGGVELAWAAAAGAVEGFRVYRRDATRTGYGAPLAGLGAEATGYLDASAVYGRRYIYTVCALAAREPPIESAPAGEREIDYQDRFAPEPPRAPRALGGPGEARLLWEASPDPDVAGYVVYRADPEQEFRQVTPEPVAGLDYLDRGLGAGLVFRYRIAAVDRAGNLGEPSEPVAARVP